MRLAIATAAAASVAVLALPAAAQSLDRYGGGYPQPPYAQQQQQAPAYAQPGYAQPGYAQRAYAAPANYPAPAPSAAAVGLRMLSWAGKEAAKPAAPPAMQTARYPSAAPTYRPMPQRTPRYAAMPADGRLQPRPFSDPNAPPRPAATYPVYGAPPARPASSYPTYAATAPAVQTGGVAAPYAFAAPPAVARTAMGPQGGVAPPATADAYAPAAAAAAIAAANPAVAAQPAGGSRLYSVHREFGLQPDPAPIPPAFFANTADLTQPETPEVGTGTKTTAGSTAAQAAVNQARLAASAQP